MADRLEMNIGLVIEPDTFGDGWTAELSVEVEGEDPHIGQFSGASASQLWITAAGAIAEVFGEAGSRDVPEAVRRLDEAEELDELDEEMIYE